MKNKTIEEHVSGSELCLCPICHLNALSVAFLTLCSAGETALSHLLMDRICSYANQDFFDSDSIEEFNSNEDFPFALVHIEKNTWSLEMKQNENLIV